MESNIFDLFAQLGATEEQLDFPVLYASAREVQSWFNVPALLGPLHPSQSCKHGACSHAPIHMQGMQAPGLCLRSSYCISAYGLSGRESIALESDARFSRMGGQGWASTSLPPPGQRPADASVAPLLDAIVARVPPPAGDPASPFALLVAMVEHDAFLGPVATGRIASGTASVGDRVRVLHHSGALLTCATPFSKPVLNSQWLVLCLQAMGLASMWTPIL